MNHPSRRDEAEVIIRTGLGGSTLIEPARGRKLTLDPVIAEPAAALVVAPRVGA